VTGAPPQTPPRELTVLSQTLGWIKGVLLPREGKRAEGKRGEKGDKGRVESGARTPSITNFWLRHWHYLSHIRIHDAWQLEICERCNTRSWTWIEITKYSDRGDLHVYSEICWLTGTKQVDEPHNGACYQQCSSRTNDDGNDVIDSNQPWTRHFAFFVVVSCSKVSLK